MSDDRPHDLIQAFIEKRLGDEEARELNALLDADDDVRREFVRAVDLHASLAQMGADQRGALSLSEALAGELPVSKEEARGEKRSSTRREASVLVRSRPRMAWTPYVIVPLSVAAAAFLVLSIGGGGGSDDTPPPRAESHEVGGDYAAREEAPAHRVAATDDAVANDLPDMTAPEASVEVRDERGATDEPVLAVAEVDAPVVPETYEPAPAPVAPDAQPEAGHLAYLDYLEGSVELQKADEARWAALRTGAPLGAGDRIRARFARARIAFESGTVLHVNRFTTFTLARTERAPGLDMIGGEVYVETAKADIGFWVATPHGTAVDLGTRFGVRAEARRGTTVTVVEGAVEASTDKAGVTVRERQEVILARKVLAPGTVRDVAHPGARFAWAGVKEPARALYIAAATHSHLRIKDPMKVTRAPRGSLVGHSIVSDTDMGKDRKPDRETGGTAAWRVVLPRAGEWYLWARLYSAGGRDTRNSDGGSLNDPNSFWVKVDATGEKILGNHKKDTDGKLWYNRWHWGGDGRIEVGTPRGLAVGRLEAGEHLIRIRSRDSLLEKGRLYSPILDALCLTDDPTYVPTDDDCMTQFRK